MSSGTLTLGLGSGCSSPLAASSVVVTATVTPRS
jgi:hypothetical protein